MSSSLPSTLDPDVRPGRLPVVVADSTHTATDWVAARRDALRACAAEHGAVVVRGLPLRDVAAAAAVFARLGSALMTEREAFAPRTEHVRGVYSSTTWPAQQPMCMHNELSYATVVPGRMLFACLTAPASGGGTGIADGAAVLADLPAELVERAERVGWQLVRRYNPDIGASWADAFGTGDPAAVDRYCAEHAIEREWLPDGGLRTRQRRAATLRHPASGRRCWFNQIAFLSEWTMDADVREFLVDEYGSDGLPFTTRWGDGTPVGEDAVSAINDVYDRHTRREPWQAGDLMVVDNVAAAHSREPFTGPREVVVAMTDAVVLP